jgi:hypothetical protein
MPNLAGFIQKFFSGVWNEGRVDLIDELIAPDCAIHGLHVPMTGTAPFKEFHAGFNAGFHQWQVTVDEEVIDGERVAFRSTVHVTHRHTGKTASFMGGGMCRVRNGKIIEAWNAWDFLSMLQQVGHVPADAMVKALTPPG